MRTLYTRVRSSAASDVYKRQVLGWLREGVSTSRSAGPVWGVTPPPNEILDANSCLVTPFQPENSLTKYRTFPFQAVCTQHGVTLKMRQLASRPRSRITTGRGTKGPENGTSRQKTGRVSTVDVTHLALESAVFHLLASSRSLFCSFISFRTHQITRLLSLFLSLSSSHSKTQLFHEFFPP